MSTPKKYTLTLHKKSYLLKGITKDDSNKEDVKKAGAKWNGSLGGWLFFPKEHEAGLKLAKKLKAKIDIDDKGVKEDKEDKKSKGEEEDDEVKDEGKRKSVDDKYKKKYKKLKKEMKEKCFEFAQLALSQIDSYDSMDNDTLENLWNRVSEKVERKQLAIKVVRDDEEIEGDEECE